jgi:hypothetical protein
MRYEKVFWQAIGELFIDTLVDFQLPFAVHRLERVSTWSFRYVHGLEYFTMPRKKTTGDKNTQASVSTTAGTLKWLNVTLDTEDISGVVALIESKAELANELVGLIETGGNFSVRFNADKGNWSCFMSDNRGDSASAGFGISASANTPLATVAACIIKLRIWKSSPERFAATGGDLGIR